MDRYRKAAEEIDRVQEEIQDMLHPDVIEEILREIFPPPGEPVADPGRVAQLTAHRACCGEEHDPERGKLHGCCVICGVPWPCEYAGKPPAPPPEPGGEGEGEDPRGRSAVRDVLHERKRQDDKWGEQNHDPAMYLTILMEEVGEMAQAALHHRFGGPEANNLRTEAVQVAAVAVAIVECLDRGKWSWKEPRDDE